MEKLWLFLLSGRFIPGSFVLAWIMLSNVSTAHSALTLFVSLNEWVNTHVLYGFFVGFGLMTLCFFWPDIKFPRWMKMPLSLKKQVAHNEQVSSESIKILSGGLSTLTNGHFDLHKFVMDLAEDRTKAMASIGEAERRVNWIEKDILNLPSAIISIIDLHDLLKHNRALLRTLESSMSRDDAWKAIEDHLQSVFMAVPDYGIKLNRSSTELQIYVTACKSGESVPEDRDFLKRNVAEVGSCLREAFGNDAVRVNARVSANRTSS